MKKCFVVLGVVGAMVSAGVNAQEHASKFYVGAGYGVVSVPEVEGVKFSDANNGFIQLGYKFSENFSVEGQYSKSTKDASANTVIEDMDVSEIFWADLEAFDPAWGNGTAQQIFPYAVIDLATKVEANIETSAIYGVYRSSGDLYFKVKAGYLREESTVTLSPSSFDFYAPVGENVTPNEPLTFTAKKGEEFYDLYVQENSVKATESESGFSGGLGVGYKFNSRIFSELEYVMLNDDLDMYSLSINYAF